MNEVESTELQKRAVNNIVQQKLVNGRVNKKKALIDAGYSESIARVPKLVTETVGFKQLMDKYLPDENLVVCLNEDIVGKPGNRLGELKLAFELKGHKSDNINLDVTNKRETDLLRELLDKGNLDIDAEVINGDNIQEQYNSLKEDNSMKGDEDEQSTDNN